MRRYSAKAALVALAIASTAANAAPAYRLATPIAGADGGWDLASVDPVAHRLYVARSDAVMAVDLRTGVVTSALAPAQRGHAALGVPGTHDVLVTNGNANTATLLDGLTGTVRATIPTGKNPDAAAYDPVTRTLWVMNPDSEDITVIDPRSAKVLATVQVGGGLELAVTDGRGHLFVNVEDRNEVAVIDTRARKLLRRFPLTGCDGPTGIAFAPDSNRIVSACANGVAIVSSPSGKLLGSVTIGPRPDGALYDARRRMALIPSGGDGTLAVLGLAPTPRLLERIVTAKGARTAALDPSSGRIYLPAADFLPAVGKDRPKAIPGTFRVIVLTPSSR